MAADDGQDVFWGNEVESDDCGNGGLPLISQAHMTAEPYFFLKSKKPYESTMIINNLDGYISYAIILFSC
jgi:hypothetical protein